MKRILYLATGGTIASAPSAEGYAPALEAQQLIDGIPELDHICDIHTKSIMSKDSSNMQPEDWIILAESIYSDLDNYDGIVITHGTDTMAFTASALTFMLQNISKPVVLTGSRIPFGEQNSDAIKNIIDSFVTACEDMRGVYIVFDGKIIKGCRASKLRSKENNIFESVNYPYLGVIENQQVRYLNKPNPIKDKPFPLLLPNLDPRIYVLKLFPGLDLKVMDSITELNIKAVIIESFGLGGVPFEGKSLLSSLGRLLEKGIFVVITTQCKFDGVDLTVYEVGQKTQKMGVISSHDMTFEAVVTKLMWALGQSEAPDDVNRIMSTNYADEVTFKDHF